MDLNAIFKSVSAQLTQQQSTLNDADDYNHDHGDHMVQIFNLIQNAVDKKSEKPVAEQLSYASKVVEREAESGSAKLYAQGLANAAKNFSDTELEPDTLGLLVKGLLNVNEGPSQKEEQNLLGSILSGLTGQTGSSEEDDKMDMDDLVRGGLAFLQAKQAGSSNSDALIDALMAASPLGESKHRAMSGTMIASTIMDYAKSSNR